MDIEGCDGLGRAQRRRMKSRWKLEGRGLSLKEWAKRSLVGDAAQAWIHHKLGDSRATRKERAP